VSVELIDETHLVMSVKEPPVQGRANTAVIEQLADYYNTFPREQD